MSIQQTVCVLSEQGAAVLQAACEHHILAVLTKARTLLLQQQQAVHVDEQKKNGLSMEEEKEVGSGDEHDDEDEGERTVEEVGTEESITKGNVGCAKYVLTDEIIKAAVLL